MTMTPTPATATLFERLGGAEGIAGLVDDIFVAHLENPAIQARFLPYKDDAEKVADLKEHMCRFMAAGTGGPNDYAGRSMPDAHRGMNISEQEYMAATDDIMSVLAQHGIDEPTQKDVLAILYGLKAEILRL